MNGFTKKSVGTLTLGEKLGKIRSDRRISLSEASRATKIQVKYLEYLEAGAYEKLPADVYVKGFLRNYSEFLGIDEKILVKLYEKERGIKDNLERGKKGKKGNLPVGREKINISPFVITPRIIAITAVLLLIFGGFFYLYREVGSFASAPRLVIISPEKNYSTDGNSVEVSGITDRDAKIFINEQPVMVNDEGKFRENLTVQSGTNTVTIRAVNRFEKVAVETLTIQSTCAEPQENPSAADNPENGQMAQAENSQKLQIEVRVDPGPVWVGVEADGNLVFSGTMLSGTTQSFQAENKIVINSGKGKATFVKFNGKDRGALSDSSGAARGVEFNRDTKL
ncbi:MAG: RodZ domain-containing protein [Parcubacteria group bacterium]